MAQRPWIVIVDESQYTARTQLLQAQTDSAVLLCPRKGADVEFHHGIILLLQWPCDSDPGYRRLA